MARHSAARNINKSKQRAAMRQHGEKSGIAGCKDIDMGRITSGGGGDIKIIIEKHLNNQAAAWRKSSAA